MSRIAKSLVCLVACAIIAAVGVSAQAAAQPVAVSSGGNADARIIAFDVGMVAGYNIGSGGLPVGRSFGLNITVADNFSIGFVSLLATRTYSLLRMSYGLTPALGFAAFAGTDNNGGSPTAAGAGIYYNILKSKTDAGLATALKVRLDYLFDVTAGIAAGDVVLTLGTSVGL